MAVLRVVARYERKRKLLWDDWMIIWSMGWNIVVVGFIFAMVQEGMGLHTAPAANLVMIAKFLLVANILYMFNLKLWYPDIPGRCIDQVTTWIANAASTILTDLAILVLPIPQVWKLQLRRVIFASAYQFTVLFSYNPANSAYTLAPTVGWTAIEASTGIISAFLPTLRPALQLATRILRIRGTLPALIRSRSIPFSQGSQLDSNYGVPLGDNSPVNMGGHCGNQDKTGAYRAS
ncbi:uncharacterized protein ATNIH1004_003174 [Aspergillus tanneri]|uniref:Rhodopsin domain-containing protein n=1 Tax=Aspergillus tanneri TaxID=1220188 RepID=A0A5M9MUB7_9EURO|nr:uncharacterized protein ATNIH1004_003174 [Aspergillus tanneri]KAA8650488.1 hypothetical protein ATNIH1004_003174 [Aspergillus tanneri]